LVDLGGAQLQSHRFEEGMQLWGGSGAGDRGGHEVLRAEPAQGDGRGGDVVGRGDVVQGGEEFVGVG
jgi:hypothetical protein